MATKYRRTLGFLSAGKIHLKTSVKVVSIFYSLADPSCVGVKAFIKEKVPQIQYKNPEIQIVSFKNTKTTPQVTVYHSNDTKTFIDCRYKQCEQILEELSITCAKPLSQVEREAQLSLPNPANFGDVRKGQYCICRIPGQIPCPSIKQILNVDHSWKNKGRA